MTAASDLHVPGPVARYLSGLLAATRSSLHDDLEAIYVTGSIALGDFQPATSDVDLLVATRSTLPHGRLAELADGVAAVSIPVRGLEYVVYPLAALRDPEPTLAWELNLNVGPRLAARHTGFDPSAEPRYWSVLDLALARQSGLPLVGPAASALIASIPREWLRSALKESLAWHEAEDRGSPESSPQCLSGVALGRARTTDLQDPCRRVGVRTNRRSCDPGGAPGPRDGRGSD